MRIALAADHAGFDLKDELAAWLREAGHEVIDLGTNGPDSVDYPDLRLQAGRRDRLRRRPNAASRCAARGSASRSPSTATRPAAARGSTSRCRPRLAREHNDANVIALGARLIGLDMAKACVDRLPRHRFRRRAPPAPRRPALQPPARTATDGHLADPPAQRRPAAAASSPSALAEADPAVAEAIAAELDREQTQIELIASENIVSRARCSRRRARCSPTNMPRAIRAGAIIRAASRRTRSRRWRSSAPSSCSAAASPTSSRIRARRPMAR